MGITGSYYRISSQQMDRILENPEKWVDDMERVLDAALDLLLCDDDPDLDSLDGLPDDVKEWIWMWAGDEDSGQRLSIDKSWQSIHFLLTGKIEGGEPPFSYIVLGGAPVVNSTNSDIWSYGPPNYLGIDQVEVALDALNRLTEEDLRQLYNPDSFIEHEIYGYDPLEVEGEFELMNDYVSQIRVFFNEAALNKEAVLFWLS